MKILTLLFIFLISVLGKPKFGKFDYTEDLVVFKSQQFNSRMQLVTGCWLYTKQYLELHPQFVQQFQAIPFNKLEVRMVKKCLKNIQRKDSLSKMKALVQPGSVSNEKSYLDIVGIFTEIDALQESLEFEEFLEPYLQKYRVDLVDIQKKGFKQQIQKRKPKRKLFGIINIGDMDPTTILIVVTLVIIGIMTFVRYKNKISQTDAKRGKKKHVRNQ